MEMTVTEEEFRKILKMREMMIDGKKIQKVRMIQEKTEEIVKSPHRELNLLETLIYSAARIVVITVKILFLVVAVLAAVAKIALDLGKGQVGEPHDIPTVIQSRP